MKPRPSPVCRAGLVLRGCQPSPGLPASPPAQHRLHAGAPVPPDLGRRRRLEVRGGPPRSLRSGTGRGWAPGRGGGCEGPPPIFRCTRPGLHPVWTRCLAAQPSPQFWGLEFPSGETWGAWGLRAWELRPRNWEVYSPGPLGRGW